MSAALPSTPNILLGTDRGAGWGGCLWVEREVNQIRFRPEAPLTPRTNQWRPLWLWWQVVYNSTIQNRRRELKIQRKSSGQHCRVLLGAAWCCWALPGAAGHCRALLGTAGCSWELLGDAGCCWVLQSVLLGNTSLTVSSCNLTAPWSIWFRATRGYASIIGEPVPERKPFFYAKLALTNTQKESLPTAIIDPGLLLQRRMWPSGAKL